MAGFVVLVWAVGIFLLLSCVRVRRVCALVAARYACQAPRFRGKARGTLVRGAFPSRARGRS
eukprot:6908311-Pyramimonas_sp.AAC.1